MPSSILATKLYIPPPQPKVVRRRRLIDRLNDGLHGKLTLISAPAGFGKTTLISEWVAGCQRSVAWLSLDEGDGDVGQFLAYVIAALQTISPTIGEGALRASQSPQPPSPESILTAVVNDITTLPDPFLIVLDDYHVIESSPVDKALSFLLDHLPPQMHLVIATREDPPLPLARLRARGQLTELRATDLRFTPTEAATFLNQAVDLQLSAEDIAALETRTEGWIAGLQLAALALQGSGTTPEKDRDVAGFITSFTGSHRFVLDYLVEEVLQQQPKSIQTFLLRTSILDRLCGPLCDAVLGIAGENGSSATLDYLERANLFIIPLDNERRWYRYHHLFADLLRQRLASATDDEAQNIADYHIRASQWYEEHDLEIEAFHHAAAANDFDRAERLIEGKGMPLHFRGTVAPILNWLGSLPKSVLDDWPSLWTTYASVLLVTGQTTGVEEKLQAAEAALAARQGRMPDDKFKDLIGRVAAIRSTLAATLQQVETIITQSHIALENLHPDNLAFRTSTLWKLGFAYHLQGDRAAARQAYTEVIAIGQATGNTIFTITATIGLANLQEADNQLHLAAETYRQVLHLFGDQPLPLASEAHLGLARIAYQWNDLDSAKQHTQHGLHLAQQIESSDRFVACQIFLARLKLAQDDVDGAAEILTEAERSVRRYHFAQRKPEVAAVQVLILLRQGKLAAAAQLAQAHKLPRSQGRVFLAQGDAAAALAMLAALRQQAEVKDWADERLKVMVLQAVASQANGEGDTAVSRLSQALTLAEPGGFIRLFVDEGTPMAHLLTKASRQGIAPQYVGKLLAAFPHDSEKSATPSKIRTPIPDMVEPLSQRELEVLQLIAQGLSNQEISQRLFIALNTVKGHNRNIYSKLSVQRRTEAVARARELGLL